VDEADVVRAIMFVLDHNLGGTYNVAGDGLLPWSEVASICGKRLVPLPPVGRTAVARVLARAGIELPPEVLDLLTYGRGADNRRLKRAGFDYRHTSVSAVHAFAESARVRHTVGSRTPYHYERDVEQFFRHSPAVVRGRPR
jgi:UDP-glucose 4-epimerase